MSNEHKPVLAEESIEGLKIQNDGYYIDCTFGRGGHSRLLLEQLGPEGKLLAFDKDVEAINSQQAQDLLKDPRFAIEHSSFAAIGEVVKRRGWQGQVAGILMDLGVSSPQLDQADRGFSFLRDGPLDMRMDSRQPVSAASWVAESSEEDMVTTFKQLGEERFARRIAAAIVAERANGAITTTGQLARLIEKAVPRKEPGKHPATRCFQAIRIQVNGELDDLLEVLQQGVDVLANGGRLAVISFHSLEDRIVKRFIRDQSRGAVYPKGLPIPDDAQQPRLKKIGKAIKASASEVALNVRSRSAILRIAEKVAE